MMKEIIDYQVIETTRIYGQERRQCIAYLSCGHSKIMVINQSQIIDRINKKSKSKCARCEL